MPLACKIQRKVSEPLPKKKSWVYIPAFYYLGSLGEACSCLPFLCPWQTPFGRAGKAQGAVAGPGSPTWLHVEEWGLRLSYPDWSPSVLATAPHWLPLKAEKVMAFIPDIIQCSRAHWHYHGYQAHPQAEQLVERNFTQDYSGIFRL